MVDLDSEANQYKPSDLRCKWYTCTMIVMVVVFFLVIYTTTFNFRSHLTLLNAPAVNLKIEQAQTNSKWSILSCNFQKYSS